MKVLKDFPDYIIYKDGSVFSNLSNKVLKDYPDKYGYRYVILKNNKAKLKTVKVHRLVAIAYIPNPDEKPQVNHLDGDKTNNRVENLCWATAKENIRHAWDSGFCNQSGVNNNQSKLTEDQVHKVCRLLEQGARVIDIHSEVGIPKHFIHSIKSKQSWAYISDDYDIDYVKRKDRLSTEKIRKICEMILDGGATKDIAKELDVSQACVNRLKRKETHRHISCEYF